MARAKVASGRMLPDGKNTETTPTGVPPASTSYIAERRRLIAVASRIGRLCVAAVQTGDANICAQISSGLESIERLLRRIIGGGL